MCYYHVMYVFQSNGWMYLYELSGCGFESHCGIKPMLTSLTTNQRNGNRLWTVPIGKDWAGPSKKIRKSFLNSNVIGINNLDIIVDETISSKMTNPIADNDKYTETIKLDHTRLAKILIQTFDLNVKGLVSKYWSNLHKFLYQYW